MDHHHRHRDNTPEHGSNPNSRTKPQRRNLGTPGDNESYNKKTTEVSAGDVFPEENPEAYDSQGSNDARRKGELNHAIFVKLQEISQYNIEIGNYDEGLANYDRCIDHLLRTLPQGPSASMFKDFLIKTVKYLNEVALKLLQEEKVKDSLVLLERCRKMTHPNSFGPYPTLRSLTYNHLGCCYRRIGKLDKAVYYLEKAWEFIQDIERVETSGITHINLCAVLSQLGDHKRALEHATMAVSDCSFDLIEATKKNAESGDPKANVHKQATMLAIAYHNLATEEEACKNGEAALQAYLRAYNLIREHNHPQHELCQKFGRAYEEARARISKPGFNKRTASPGEAARRYGTSPPGSRQVVVKRPASFNTANKAAKAYLQNNRVVIPKRQGTAVQQPRPLLSSPQNAQLTQKLFVPSASQRKIERPVTAHPQSRTQHYQVSGLNETPRNQKESLHKHEDEEDDEAPNRPSHSEANSEIERLGLDDEDLEKADLKSNRLAFLQSLNQYNMDKSSKGGVVPQRNNFMGGTPDNKAAAQQQQEQGHQEKRARIQSAKPQGRAQAKPKVDQAKIDKAVVKLQSFCRGYLARQEVAKVLAETPQQVYLVLIAETVKGNLENGPYSKETLYFFLMIYELDSQLIHIHIKNLENRKFHRALVEYQVANRTSKAAIINELREACERLIQHLEIHNDQIVFRDDVTDRGEKPEELYMMGQELARREAENAITQITERTEERTDESEVRPLGSKKEEEELGSEGGHRKPGHSHSHSHSGDMIEDKIEEEGLIVDDIAEEDDRYEEEGFDEEPADKKKSQKSKPKQQKQPEVEEEVEEFEEQPVVDTNDIAGLVGLKLFGGRDQEEVDKAAQTIQKHVKGKLERDKYQVAKDKKKEEEERKEKEEKEKKKKEEEKKKKEEAEKRKKEEEERKEKEEEEKKKKEEERKKKEEAEKRKKEEEERKEKEEEEKKKKEEEERKKKKEEEEELPNLEDPEVQNATLTIQKAYKRKEEEKRKKEEQEKKKKEEEEKTKKEEEEKKKKKEEEEELPNLEDPDVQNATLAIQKAYKRKEQEKKKKEEEEKKKKEEEEKKKKEEEELPNLEDPDVQNATLAIQKAYKRKEQEKKKKEEEKKKQEEEKKKKEEEEKKKKEEEEELPNLEDPDVQNATLTIQKAYKKKEEKKKKEEEEKKKKEEEEKKKKEEEEKKKKEEEELPNLDDPDVQNATLTIQKAYKKKKDKKEVKEEPKQEEKQSEEESQPESVPLPRRDTISLYKATTKEELDKAAQTIQKHIKGKLTRDTFGLTKDHRSKLVFSRATRIQGNIISFKLVERGDEPDSYIVSCKNITTNKKFETIEIPKKLVNLKTLTIDGLVEILNVDVYAPKVTLKDKFKGKVGQKSPAYDEKFDVEEEEEEVKPVEKNKKEGDGTEFLASVPLYFGKEKLDSTIHYDKKKDQILVKHGFEHGKEAKSLDIPVQDLEIGTEFSKDYFISNMDIVLLSKLNYKNGNLVYDRSPMHLPATKIDMKEKKLATPNKRYNQDFDDKDLTSVREDEDNKKEGHSALQESYRSGNFEVNQEAEELIGKKGGQIRTQSIDAVGEVGHYRSGNVFAPGQVKMGKGTAEAEKQKKKEVDDELPNLEDPDVQNATLTIQKAYKNKKDKKVQEVQEKPKQKEEEKHQHKHKEEEELPDLEDKDVQKATLTIQNAYKNKKNKQNKPAQEEPKHHHHHHHEHHKKEEKEEEELPNLEDKDVQNATLTIQKAYKNKKNKQNKPAKEEPKPQVKEEEGLPDLEDKDVQNATLTIQKAYKNKKTKQNKVPELPVEEKPVEKEDELPNLEDKDVQNATLTIQKAYKNKKNKQNKPAQEEPKYHDQHHQHKKEEEEELPNLEDKDVQNATLTIQKAYKNKKNKQNKPVKEEPKPQEKEEEELPNLEDKDVQNATLTIQKAYKNKKNKQNKPVKEELVIPEPVVEKPKKKEEEEELPNLEDKDVQNATLTIQKAYKNKKNKQNKLAQEEPQHHHPHRHEHHKKEEEEELPNLEDKDVQNATLTIQKAYKNKKNKQNKPPQEEPKPQPKEAEEEELPNLEDKDVQNATLTIQKAYKNKKKKQNQPVKEEPKPQPKEEEEELPNLEDKDVQNATLTIQKAYKNKKNKQNKTVKEELVIPEPVVEKPKEKEEEEELPNLEDKDVQNATLTIQKAYKNKKNKQNQPVKEEPVIPEPVIEKPKQKEEEEELPNLEDPEVQNATLAIQKAYLKKKSKAAQPEKKPSPKKEVKPAARKDDSADDYDYEPDFSEPKTSPVKPKPQVVADKKDKKADKSENFELMNVTNEQKPEDVEKLLKEVNDEFDVFNQKDNRSDDDNKPYDEEEAPPKKKSPPKKKANDDDEDFEPIEGDF